MRKCDFWQTCGLEMDGWGPMEKCTQHKGGVT